MKKLLIGCAIFFVVAALGVGGGCYFFVIRPAQAVAEQLEEIQSLDQQVQNQDSFSAPPNELLTEDQVTRFVRVQQTIRQELGDKYRDFYTEFKEMEERNKAGDGPGVFEILGFFGDVLTATLDAKRVQVRSINEAGFSLDEYNWVRERAFEALGAGFAKASLEQIVEAAQKGELADIDLGQDRPTSAPEENVALLTPYQDEFKNWAGFAVFGL